MAFPALDRIRNFAAWQMAKDTFNGFMEDNCLSRGAAIAYFTIFSLAPILVVVIAIAGFVFGDDAARGVIFKKLQGMVGPDAAGLVQSMIQSAANKRSGIIATVFSVVMLLLTASGVFGELQSSLNIIWKAGDSPHGTVTRLIKARAQSLGLVATMGFLLLVSLAISAALTAAWHRVDQVVPGASSMLRYVNLALSFALTTVLFGTVYKVLPDKKLEWRDVLIGSIFTALLYTVGKTAIALYVGSSRVASSYGAASALVVLLLWVYYSAQIFLLGAEFTKVYAFRHGSQVGKGRRRFWDRMRGPSPVTTPGGARFSAGASARQIGSPLYPAPVPPVMMPSVSRDGDGMTDDDRGFMTRAIALSEETSIDAGAGGAFGCVIVQNGVIIGEGANRVVAENDPTWHAEMAAIRNACRTRGSFKLSAATLYTSAEPCPMCMAACYWAGITAVFYASQVEDALQYGNFDDSMIYDEIRKPVGDRAIVIKQIMRAEAVEVWKKYQAKEDKVQY